jgi:hypothetical protein
MATAQNLPGSPVYGFDPATFCVANNCNGSASPYGGSSSKAVRSFHATVTPKARVFLDWLKAELDRGKYSSLEGSFEAIDISDVGEFLKAIGPRSIPHEAVYIHHQTEDERKYGWNGIKGFAMIFLKAQRPLKSFDPGPPVRFEAPPNIPWLDKATSNFRLGKVTGTVPEGTVCIFGIDASFETDMIRNFDAKTSYLETTTPFVAARCYAENDMFDNPTFRTFSLQDPGLGFLSNPKAWMDSHQVPARLY